MDFAGVTNGSEHFTPLACRYTRPLSVWSPLRKAALLPIKTETKSAYPSKEDAHACWL